ncbi:MAG: DUF1611 domain-containing protein [Candidatus Thermoplasmatota archaeon]|nr:DUF1611 domain-containing protein [Candidatus Thermoplasmatota archaeon]
MKNAVIIAEGVLGTTYGKTANGLLRYSKRFNIVGVVDSRQEGKDAGEVVNGKPSGIPVVSDPVDLFNAGAEGIIIGVASDGGTLPGNYRKFVSDALERGMFVVSGLHEFISDDPEFSGIAKRTGSEITDVRKIFRDMRHNFTGDILNVESKKIAVLGTDSAVGKRTTAVKLMEHLQGRGSSALMIGTGQTAWIQGFRHTIVLDAIVNDFVPGALEKVTVDAWNEERPDIMMLEGQGSVMHPAYPGSFEIIAACRPEAIILQHSPAREFYDGFPGFRIPPVETYIRILETLSGKKVIAISINREGMKDSELRETIEAYRDRYSIPVFDPLGDLREIGDIVSG